MHLPLEVQREEAAAQERLEALRVVRADGPLVVAPPILDARLMMQRMAEQEVQRGVRSGARLEELRLAAQNANNNNNNNPEVQERRGSIHHGRVIHDLATRRINFIRCHLQEMQVLFPEIVREVQNDYGEFQWRVLARGRRINNNRPAQPAALHEPLAAQLSAGESSVQADDEEEEEFIDR